LRVLGSKIDEVIRKWRKLPKEKLYNLYCSRIVHVIKSRRMLWWGNMRERDHLEDPGVDRRIKLKWIFRKLGGRGVCVLE
jgi:hypothetical protein